MAQTLANGDAALEGRRKSATSRTDHRVCSTTTLVDDINCARRSIHESLVQIAAQHRMPEDWANRFFRRSSRGA